MKFNNLPYIEESGFSYYPLKRQKILDFITNKTDEYKKYIDGQEDEYLIKRKEFSDKIKTNERNEIINLYTNYYLKKKKPENLSILKEFDLYKFEEEVFSRSNHKNDDQIIEDFLEIQTRKNIYRTDILAEFYEVGIGYKSQISALLLLETFSQYSQEISLTFSEFKDFIEISVVFSNHERRFFLVKLRTSLNDSHFKICNTNELFLEVDNNSDKDIFKNCTVTEVSVKVEIPIYDKGKFESIFNDNTKPIDKKLLFFHQYKQPYLMKFYRDWLDINFIDSSGKKIEITIYNTPILLTKNGSWLNKFMNSDFTPCCVVPLDHYLLDTLEKFDFSGIDLLSDIQCDTFKNKSEKLVYCDNKKIRFFIAGIDSHGRNFDKYKIFKIDINLETKDSQIEFYGFEEDYWQEL